MTDKYKPAVNSKELVKLNSRRVKNTSMKTVNTTKRGLTSHFVQKKILEKYQGILRFSTKFFAGINSKQFRFVVSVSTYKARYTLWINEDTMIYGKHTRRKSDCLKRGYE